MARPTKAESLRLEYLENTLANLARLEMDIRLIQLRDRQALRIDSSLTDLLTPAIITADEVLARIERCKSEVKKTLALKP